MSGILNSNNKFAEAVLNDSTADVIVNGSGFGGALAADRLVRAGLWVRVLERGPWRRTGPVLAKGLSQAEALPVQDRPGFILRSFRSSKGLKEICLNRRGLLEFHVGNGVKTLTSSSVGGDSHVWAALLARPDNPDYWNGRAEGFSASVLAPHYERTESELGAVRSRNTASIPNHTSHAWHASGWFESLNENDQYPFAFLFPEQQGGHQSADCELSELNGEDGLFGSPRAAKANVEVVYRLPHLDAGLTVQDMHEVRTLSRLRSGVYEVIAKDHHTGRVQNFQAPQVVLAAGTMNSIKILFASQEVQGLRPIEQLGEGSVPTATVWVFGYRGQDIVTAGRGARFMDA